MEKRLLLAVFLVSAVIMITNLLFPPPEPVPADEAEVAAPAVAPPAVVQRPAAVPDPAAPAREDTVVVASPLYRLAFSTRGAALLRAELLRYPSYTQEGQPVQLVPAGAADFLAHRVAVASDTIDLRQLPFQASAAALEVEGEPGSLRFTYGDPEGFGAEITYTFGPDSYLVGVQGRLFGLGGQPATLLTDVGPGLEPHEARDHHSERELAVVTRTPDRVSSMRMNKVEGRSLLDAQFTWVGIRDKYFLAALIAGEQTPFAGMVLQDLPDRQHGDMLLPQAQLTTAFPVGQDGAFAFEAYLGPQDYGRLSAVGYQLEDVTPYGYRWLQPVIRPLAAAILWVLSALHNTLGLAYGWVLVLFGVMMRVVLWPLNAKAMRAQMKNMAVQPLMQEIKEKYADDPKKQQEAMIGLYKEHGFNPLAGCLPLLVPMPVLITLFFVFQNTIAFRGAEFLWLPDLSLRDPFYILPIFLVLSTFALQWVMSAMSGIEQNPQMKMMLYFMPIMMGVIFFALPAGLNLYYATTQIASIPQQVLIARERKRAQAELKQSIPAKPKPVPTPAASAAQRRRKAKGK
jgi:YidC/Oxa1 family membrane protein insertase